MRQQPFETANAEAWDRYRRLLAHLESHRRRPEPDLPLEQFPHLFRMICGHYALARTRGYSPGLTDELHELARRGYPHLYRRRRDWLGEAISLLAVEYPRCLRRHARAFALACALLFLPIVLVGLWAAADPELIYSVMPAENVRDMETMYDPTNRNPFRTEDRAADTDFAMFGFYVFNNVGIAFRTFAAGLLLGIGSALILLFNALAIGSVAGHLTRLGFSETFWSFVSGHSSLELTAIAVAGAAGLLLGKAIWAPGRATRLAALRANAREAAILVTGAFAMLVLAALVEAFWSGNKVIAPEVKYVVGALGWVLVIAWLGLAGRGARDGP